jgi:hypothetical protein
LNVTNYSTEDGVERDESESIFQDYRKHKIYLPIFAALSEVDAETVPQTKMLHFTYATSFFGKYLHLCTTSLKLESFQIEAG